MESLRARIEAGETVVGTFQYYPSPPVTETLALAGMDFVIPDQEHSPLSAERTMEMAMAAQGAGAGALVRVRRNDPAEIQRALDLGADGVMVPQVETHDDAVAARDAARYAPLGDRGLSKYVRAGGYVGGDEFTREQNETAALVVQIEGERGVENVDEILGVEGIDTLFLGPYDLSASLDIPGQVRDERVESLMEEVCAEAAAAGVAVGAYADDPAMANRWLDAGVQLVALSVEGAVLYRAVEDLLAEL
ncbi:MAG: HpcH/HpaI aldolase/citrate lyase family protein [Halobacteriaceae archaeon]